jgi:hypothetical protein
MSISFDDRAFKREIQKAAQAGLEQKAAEIGREVQAMFDRVATTHQGQDVRTIECELLHQWRSLLGQEAEQGSLRDAAEAIARGDRATGATNVVWQ